ncbi:Tautomerase/MIF superfamily [Xylogone sp. PMI_703]|nr:Tautomerase/MIF superfamily [Xylogone sp. PMI_703]
MPGSIDDPELHTESIDNSGTIVSEERDIMVDKLQMGILPGIALPPSPKDSLDLNKFPTLSTISMQEQDDTVDLDQPPSEDTVSRPEIKSPKRQVFGRKRGKSCAEILTPRREPAVTSHELVICPKENITSPHERVFQGSIIMADIRTNVIINDEYTLIQRISSCLSSCYQRPESSILITVTHSACMVLGGNYEPTYTMNISALPCLVQRITNKRNTPILQEAIKHALGVVPQRGIIRFIPIPEENYATNGRTVAGELEDLIIATAKDSTANTGSLRGGRNDIKKSKRSMPNLRHMYPPPDIPLPPTPTVGGAIIPPIPPIPVEKSLMDRKAEKVRRVGRRKSLKTMIFGR